ncbi:rhamnogalacturonan acetylesterase [Acetivibrio cellulolyticus]|uniref:rhamnogalacturonan acetylesterase n=1 Tax=Acetivibrio cellulolyticus TaxID=35830 RepID=UPI0001E2EB55|nr:rhamnogalacturonan acetylesterase [Acetivibrio cellulolyticus]
MNKNRSLAVIFTLIFMICCQLTNVYGLENGAGNANDYGSANSVDFEYITQKFLKILINFLPASTQKTVVIPTFVVTPALVATPTPVPSVYPTSATIPTVYLAGDSTVQTYNSSYSPLAGWGQMIGNYFTSDVKFVNKAIGGRSSKNFVTEGRLDEILNAIQKGDYLFVQFSHNDATSKNPDCYADPFTTYKEYLAKYVDGARKKGAIPVLITPAAQLSYRNGTYINDFQYYCYAMKQVAYEKNCAIIDLMTKCLDYYATLDYDQVYTFYMVSSNGKDFTHFTETGALEVARLVSNGVKEINVPISKCVK